MLDHGAKCLVTPCILLHGTPFPFSGSKIYIYHKFKCEFFFFLDPECHWRPVVWACPVLAYWCGPLSRPLGAWLVWWAWPSWSGGSCRSWRSLWPLSRKFCFYSSGSTIFRIIILLKYFVSLKSWGCRWCRRDGKRRRSSGGGRGRPIRWCGRCYQRRVGAVRHRLWLWWGCLFWIYSRSTPAQGHWHAF